MVWVALLLWAGLPLFFPASLLTSLIDIPVVSLLLANKKIHLARFGAFLCLWNTPYDPTLSLFWIAFARLVTIELTYFLTKHMLSEMRPRALLASSLLPLISTLISLSLMPLLASNRLTLTAEWTWQLLLITPLLSMLSTGLLFSLRSLGLLLFKQQREVASS